ncbi:Lactonase, 7-bladed beta-propeller-domain-containing protein [Phialemonium atrogriseum]|uniref:Lactonase, 7-bladed beta-propeller-domain-containing protein n=1 Tax=Phialemonium atrogriseum TaxID=1093897 RepID=A0AAJ0C945_9PEZI|nr:Lactonase, 7-bladed beta-propeller-domain-containing protein [Phialemonium atrogriseum]KAK1772240.1 Lactonase, 7-bladed beta-propeller-domain-containing protein [Phialemonium atrogriseum]
MRFTTILAACAAATTAVAAPSMKRASKPDDKGNTKLLLGNTGHIYIADFKDDKFSISLNQSVTGDPAWMAFAEPNRVYAVDEFGATLRLFILDLDKNTLELKAEQTGSAGVVHLEFNRDKTRLVGAGYGAGKIDVWNIENSDLKLIKTIDSPGPLGPDKNRQATAHPHQAVLDPSGRFFAVNDLGTDTILLLDSKDDAFEVVNRVPVSPGGCGPRHGVFVPDEDDDQKTATHYVVVCEMASLAQVFSLDYATDNISFAHAQSVSTYGDTPPPSGQGAAAGEVAISPGADGAYVYVSNRMSGAATDSIARFRFVVDGGGGGGGSECEPPSSSSSSSPDLLLQYVDSSSTGGLSPRMFGLASTPGVEDTLFVGNVEGPVGLVALVMDRGGARGVGRVTSDLFDGPSSGPQFVMPIG